MARTRLLTAAIVSGVLLAVTAVGAGAVSLDEVPSFVAKREVQAAFDLNDRQLQAVADQVRFLVVESLVTEYEWICTNENNEQQQVRSRSTTERTQALLQSISRDRRGKVTGFIIEAVGEVTSEVVASDGPKLDSCPSGPWVLTEPASEGAALAATQSAQLVKASIDGGTSWDVLDASTQ
jgi:hypothetical protein